MNVPRLTGNRADAGPWRDRMPAVHAQVQAHRTGSPTLTRRTIHLHCSSSSPCDRVLPLHGNLCNIHPVLGSPSSASGGHAGPPGCQATCP